MKIYEVRFQDETICAFNSYSDALEKCRRLHEMFLDDRYTVVSVDKKPLEEQGENDPGRKENKMKISYLLGTRFFEKYGLLDWIEPEEYYADSWSYVTAEDGYCIVISGDRTRYAYTII